MSDKESALAVLQRHVGHCREWTDNRPCNAMAEFLLWGKLIPAEGLGPRCYEHAVKHVGYHALASRSNYALVNLADLAEDLAKESARV